MHINNPINNNPSASGYCSFNSPGIESFDEGSGLNYAEHGRVLDQLESLQSPEWNQGTRALFLQVVRDTDKEQLGTSSAASLDFSWLEKTACEKDTFIKFVIAQCEGHDVSDLQDHELDLLVTPQKVQEFTQAISEQTFKLADQYEKSFKDLEQGIHGLSDKLDNKKWDFACCEKVLKLVPLLSNRMDSGDKADKSSSVKDNPGKVSFQNLRKHIDSHFSKDEGSKQGGVIDRRQFLQLVVAAQRGTGASQPTRNETEVLLSMLQGLLAALPGRCQSALLKDDIPHNPMSHLEPERAFRQPQEQGRALDKLTLPEKALWLFHTLNSVSAITTVPETPPTLKRDAKIGEQRQSRYEMPDKNASKKAADMPVAAGPLNAAANSLLAGMAVTAIAGPVAGAAAALLALLPDAVQGGRIIGPIAPNDSLSNLYPLLDANVNMEPNKPVLDYFTEILAYKCKRSGMSGDVFKKIQDTKVKVSVFNINKGGLLTGTKNTFIRVTPLEIATGELLTKLTPLIGSNRAHNNQSYKIEWPAEFKNNGISTTFTDDSLQTYVNMKMKRTVSSATALNSIKDSIRASAETNAYIHNQMNMATHTNFDKVSSEDLNDVQQIKFKGYPVSNLFLVGRMIHGTSSSFVPVKLKDAENNLAGQTELLKEMNAGLPKSQQNKVPASFASLEGKYNLLKMFFTGVTSPFSLGEKGRVQDILAKVVVDNFEDDFDRLIVSRGESTLFALAGGIDVLLKLLPFWAPFTGMSISANIGLGLCNAVPSTLKALAEDDRAKTIAHLRDSLTAFSTHLLAGILATRPIIPRGLSLAKEVRHTADKILDNPNDKLITLSKFVDKLFSMKFNFVAKDTQTVAAFLKFNIPPAVINLLVRFLGGGSKAVYNLLATASKERQLAAANAAIAHIDRQSVTANAPIAPRDSTLNYVSYTIEEGDTFKDIAKKAYGANREDRYVELFNANRDLLASLEGPLPVGQTLRIPVVPGMMSGWGA